MWYQPMLWEDGDLTEMVEISRNGVVTLTAVGPLDRSEVDEILTVAGAPMGLATKRTPCGPMCFHGLEAA